MTEKVVSITSKGQLTIPKNLREKFGLKEGTKAIAIETSKGVLIKPIPHLSELMGVDAETLADMDIHAEIREVRREADRRLKRLEGAI